jgi:hypothetical protein
MAIKKRNPEMSKPDIEHESRPRRFSRTDASRFFAEVALPVLIGAGIGLILRVLPPFSWIGMQIRTLMTSAMPASPF